MPEGHTVHRLARDLTRDLAGQRLRVSSPQGRFADGAAEVDRKTLGSIEAYGKHLFLHWSGRGDGRGKPVTHIHLGMYGKWRRHRSPAGEPRGAVRVRIEGDAWTRDLHGPTACANVGVSGRDEIVARLGPDPLRDDADVERVWERVSSSRGKMGALWLDQSVVSGVGNIYRAELLLLAGIHPERMGRDVSREEFDALWGHTVELLKIGVRLNRIVTTEPGLVGKTRAKMARGERFMVYGRETCLRCGGKVTVWEKLGGRKMYGCEGCQG